MLLGGFYKGTVIIGLDSPGGGFHSFGPLWRALCPWTSFSRSNPFMSFYIYQLLIFSNTSISLSSIRYFYQTESKFFYELIWVLNIIKDYIFKYPSLLRD